MAHPRKIHADSEGGTWMVDGGQPLADPYGAVDAPSRGPRVVPVDSAPDAPAPETRRERQRRETVEEIKTAARRHLTIESTSQLSLRAVARDVGLTPSAIYRYFESQQQLVGAVANDAFASATAAMRIALDGSADCDAARRMGTAACAYRTWAWANRAEFNLMFGTDLAGLAVGPGAVDVQTLGAFYAVPLAIYAAGVGSGEVAPELAPTEPPAELAPQLLAWAADLDDDLTTCDLTRLVSAWSAFHGHLILELFGHLDGFYVDRDAAFARRLRELLISVGLAASRTGDASG